MLLQQLFNFQWLNEPQGVFFLDNGMKVVSNPETNFWQNKRLSISRDNGHFFYSPKNYDFSLVLKWDLNARPINAQSGIMLRFDKENFARAYSIWDNNGKTKICTSITNEGFSDLSEIELDADEKSIWFKANRRLDNFELSYSIDGQSYIVLRKFTFINIKPEINAGAFICNPNNNEFEAVLSHLELNEQ